MIPNRSIGPRFIHGLSLVAILSVMAMCSKDENGGPGQGNNSNPPEGCDTLDVSFSQDIQPGLDNTCVQSGCHNSQSQAAGIALETHQQIKNAVNNNPFRCAINHGSGCANMPQGGPKLPDSAIHEIECWIDDGMPDN